jgi:hypothetical protein
MGGEADARHEATFVFLLAVASAAAVLIAGAATRTEECRQTSPAWVSPFVFVLGTISIVAVFAGIVAWGRGQGWTRGWQSVGCIIQAALGAGIWGVVGFFALFVIVVPSGCLD